MFQPLPAARLWRLLPFLVTLAGIAGLWIPAVRAERRIVDRLHEALARHAAAYLAVATPAGAAGGYDPARLLSGAHALAGATFWPGEVQVALGSTALVPDQIGFLPLPESVQAVLDQGTGPVVLERSGERATLVAFSGADGMPLGWVASWGALEPALPTPVGIVLSTIVMAASLAGLGIGVLGASRRRLGVALGLAALAGVVLVLELADAVSVTAREAAGIRLVTARQLVEVAATAPQVRQAELPVIAAGLGVEARRGAVGADEPVHWGDSGAEIVAATPRTQGSLVLRLGLPDPDLAGLPQSLALWSLPFGLGLLGLGLSGLRRLS